ncbi:MAG TPA: amidohydrolase family protein [Acetobacteraceae bacterium]|nr:amidohydrolase family protein [Acetobacteraceae bacterium]
MNVEVAREPRPVQETRFGIVDCDIHPLPRKPEDITQFMSERWRKHAAEYGNFFRQPFFATTPYPRSQPYLSRRDAFPPNGAPPGSDLDFMRAQLLDAYGVECGMMQVLFPNGGDQRNLEYGAALCHAINEWQLAYFSDPEPRLKASCVVTQEDPTAAIKEIELRAGDRRFGQVFISPRTLEPLGRRRYRPVLEAVTANGFAVGLHSFGYNGHATQPGGPPSYYVEEHHSNVQSAQALITSLVMEGAFEDIPNLRVVIIEAGFGWAPMLAWRLDKLWARMRSEVPHVKRRPSEYIREHVWFTTQPMEEPERAGDLRRIFEWIGWERILFATDYPHWDFDDPRTAIPIRLSEQERRMVFRDNAVALYGLQEMAAA